MVRTAAALKACLEAQCSKRNKLFRAVDAAEGMIEAASGMARPSAAALDRAVRKLRETRAALAAPATADDLACAFKKCAGPWVQYMNAQSGVAVRQIDAVIAMAERVRAAVPKK